MKTGIKIKFNTKNNRHVVCEYDNSIDPEILIISLLETINDICKENNFDINKKLLKYIQMGSVDNWK